MNRCCIAIPIYKSQPEAHEVRSFERCMEIFPKEQLILVAPKSLQLNTYLELAEKANCKLEVERFNDLYFKGISGYNNLLLSKQFYARFKSFEYLLIHQLDVWVFSNQLDYWCNKGYDYVGAPSFADGMPYEPTKAWIGNGGFSLRKMNSFLSIFNDTRWYSHYASHSRHHENEPLKGYIELILLHVQAHILKMGWPLVAKRINYEDYIWSHVPGWKIPSFKDAIHFSFEKFPSKLYQETKEQLPFGCHAWQKYESLSFWKRFI